jgi:hypothetical protein
MKHALHEIADSRDSAVPNRPGDPVAPLAIKLQTNFGNFPRRLLALS